MIVYPRKKKMNIVVVIIQRFYLNLMCSYVFQLPKDSESKPKAIEPVSAKAQTAAAPSAKETIRDSPKKVDTSSASPKKSPSPLPKVAPIALPKDVPTEEIKESVFSPRPVDIGAKTDVAASPEKKAVEKVHYEQHDLLRLIY